jgi:hypothetical protein
MIPSLLEVKFYVSQNPKYYFLYSDSSPITSPIYTSGKHEESSSSFPFPPHLDLLSSHDPCPTLHSQHPEVVERSVYYSFKFFENQLFSPRISSPRLSMVGVGGASVGWAGGAVDGGQAQPPRIFSKVTARYAPLFLHVVLHDLPENYMKRLPKFMGEGDLTTTKHIAFFNQFDDILGIEHEEVYARLLVQNFEGQVRTWFRGLPVGSIRSYNDLETSFLRQWREEKYHFFT